MIKTFEIDDLIRIAKRENNTKRSYLYVNPVQGKHIPVSPSRSLELFSLLAQKIEDRYPDEGILIIGFAETATAIGSAIAYKARNCKYYMNTTRENITDAEYLFFTESHSHATEQRLVINGLENCLDGVQRIVFAEDEVTTGNTIEKLIRILQGKYAKRELKFGIVSILNSMPDHRINELESKGIICDYVHRIPVQYRVDEINNHTYLPLREQSSMHTEVIAKEYLVGNYWNSRIISSITEIRMRTNEFVQSVINDIELNNEEENILVLGTEEFMFPGLMIGAAIEDKWLRKSVLFHATTRSPIEVCEDEKYPLHNRMPLESVYGKDRRTFIYNLQKYDKVFIVSDAIDLNVDGLVSICAALEEFGNTDVTLIRWGDYSNEE